MQHLGGAQWVRRCHLHGLGTNTAQGSSQVKAEPPRDRAPLAATMAAAFPLSFNVKTTLHSDMLQPASKLWGLGIGFLKILLKFLNLRRSTWFRSFASCQLMPTLSNTQAGVSQEKGFVKLSEKHNSSTKHFLHAVSPSCRAVIVANFIPPYILRIRASNLSAGSSI